MSEKLTFVYIFITFYKFYATGKGIYKIAKELNEKGYPTPSQVARKKNNTFIWHQSTIRKILSNRFYVGDLIQNKSSTVNPITKERKINEEEIISIKNTHEAIIDTITFKEVQRRFNENKKKKAGNQKHLFSNVLVCGECGSNMHYKKDKEAYICGKLNKMGKNYCKGAYIQEKVLKEVVCTELKKIINEYICKNTLIKEIKETKKVFYVDKKIKKIEKDIVKLDQKKSMLLDMWMDDLVDEKLYLRKMQEMRGQKSLLEETKEKFLKRSVENKESYGDVIENILMFDNIDRIIINKLIEKIQVFKNMEVVISYNFLI